MDEMQKRHDEEMRTLREEIERVKSAQAGGTPAAPGGLASALEDYAARVEDLEKKVATLGKPKGALKLIDISLDGLFTAGTSTAPEGEIGSLEAGGHDPHRRGFTAQNIEATFSGAVDPYFRADASIVWQITPEGETGVELEETDLTTTSLPAGLQVKAGQFFTDFGRLNPQHPHAWEFVDQPVVNSRMFGGDGMRGPGVRLSWLAPTKFPLEISGSLQDANGETMASFINEDGVGGRPVVDRPVRAFGDLARVGRAFATFDASETTVIAPGLSIATGPNSTGGDGRTRILGADLTLKWKPLANDHGFPFFVWQSEYMERRFGAASFDDPAAPPAHLPGTVLGDAGWYSQAAWGFSRDWTLGVRYDRAEGRGEGNDADPLRDLRTRASLALTHYFSEFSKLRLQVSRDRAQHLDRHATSIWLQFEVLIGTHGAHRF